jgi:hypothetical protein
MATSPLDLSTHMWPKHDKTLKHDKEELVATEKCFILFSRPDRNGISEGLVVCLFLRVCAILKYLNNI